MGNVSLSIDAGAGDDTAIWVQSNTDVNGDWKPTFKLGGADNVSVVVQHVMVAGPTAALALEGGRGTIPPI